MANNLKDKTARGLFWGMLNNGTMQILNIVIGIFLARLLSPADYGLVGMLAVFTAIASALQESGFSAALTNIEKPTDNDYNSVFWFSTIMSVLLYTILFFCAPLIAAFFHQPELINLSRFVFLTLLFSAFGTAPTAYLFKNMMVKETTILRVSSLIVSGCVGIFLAVKGMVYWSLAWQQFTYIAMTSIWRFFIIKWRPSMHIDFAPIKRMFSFSYKILITTIVNQLSQNLLTLVFGRLFTAKNVGNFTQAFKWDTMASSFISGTVAQVAQPVLVEINDDSERQVNVFRKMLRFTAFLAFPAMFGLALIAHEFIIITISEKWIDSIPLLRILCISGAFLPFYTMYQNLVISKERSDIYMWCTIGLIAVQFILVLLTYSYGIVFMVTVYSASVILWLLVWQYYAKRLIGLKLLDAIKDILPFALISAAIMIACYYITLPIANLKLLLATRIVMAAIMYVAVMKILKVKMLDECINFIRKKKA